MTTKIKRDLIWLLAAVGLASVSASCDLPNAASSALAATRPAKIVPHLQARRTSAGVVAFAAGAPDAERPTSPAPDQDDGIAGTETYDVGLQVSYCPYGRPTRRPRAAAAGTSEAGWPAKECLKMDKGPAGRRHTLVGLNGVHNWLLGGYGNDTIIGGDRGDVIWGDYHPGGEPRLQTAIIHAGNGRNVIYANDTRDYVWTGKNPYTVVHAHDSGISGVIHCQSPYIVVYLSTVSERYFKLDGCHRISHYSVGY